jgi:hypothetical protein
MRQLEGLRSPEMREGRVRLTVRDPQIEKLLAGLAIDPQHVGDARGFGNWLWRERNRFDVERQVMFGPGLFGGRLSKADAERALVSALRSVEEPNG